MMKSILKSKYGRIIRYLISGGTAAVVDLGAIYILVNRFHFWYLGSAVAAFMLAFVFSFLLQKFFTFEEDSIERIPVEASIYLAATLVNLVLNTSLMYLCVDKLHMNYLLAQFLVNGAIAIYSYFVYKYIVFKIPNEKAQS